MSGIHEFKKNTMMLTLDDVHTEIRGVSTSNVIIHLRDAHIAVRIFANVHDKIANPGVLLTRYTLSVLSAGSGW